MSANRPLAIVTGASTGIGLELAKCCALGGFDLLIVADEPAIEDAAAQVRSSGAHVEALTADLATLEGVDQLYERSKVIRSMRFWPMPAAASGARFSTRIFPRPVMSSIPTLPAPPISSIKSAMTCGGATLGKS